MIVIGNAAYHIVQVDNTPYMCSVKLVMQQLGLHIAWIPLLLQMEGIANLPESPLINRFKLYVVVRKKL